MQSETGNFKLILIGIMLMFSSAGIFAQGISLYAELDDNDIWLGDTVQLTLYLQGSEEAISPGLDIPGVVVEPLGGTVRSSRSVTNINGKVTEKISKAYIYGFNLTPGRPGKFTVPPITLSVEGRTVSTQAIVLNVAEPEASDDFRLEISFDRKQVFIDEECRLKVSFIYSTNLRSLSFMIPGMDALPSSSTAPADSSDSYQLNVNGNPVIFKNDPRISGLTAVFFVRPNKSGKIILENSTASFESVTGVQRVRDFFGRIQQQEVYSRQVIPGGPAALEVLPFPEKNKPADFFGLSGDVKLKISAEPLEVHLGDPVTLTLEISGLNNTEVGIPSLKAYLGPGFDLPDTRSSAKVEERTKTITQTIRIKDAGVVEIPEIAFSYFDSESETYKRAFSGAIPVKVLETQVLTAGDLEGGDISDAPGGKVFIGKKKEGIYYNYAGVNLLENQKIMIDELAASPLIKIMLLAPPIIFLAVWVLTVLIPQARLRALAKADRKKALKKLAKYIKKADTSNPNRFLGAFNRMLIDFLKSYGTDQDSISTETEREKINRVIYGRAGSSADEAVILTGKIVSQLEGKEYRGA